MAKISIENHGGFGMLWFIGWLFTIGWLELGFWKGFAALLLWPYYIGEALRVILAATTP